MKRYFTLSILLTFLITSLFAQQSLQERLERHVHILASDSLEGRGLGTEGRVKALDYIENQMREIGLQPFQGDSYLQHFDFKVSLVQLKGQNVVGMIPGTDPNMKDEVIVIGAHFDHLGYQKTSSGTKIIFPGADDNASGVAGVLEMARLILSSGQMPKRTLVFIAFDAEESGLIGADNFVKADKPFPNEAIKAMFSLDMIGMLSTVNSLELKGWRTLANSDDLLNAALERNSIDIKGTTPIIERRTDTWPFGSRGIPAIYVNTGLKSPYHQPEDTADLLDYQGMAKITQFLAGLVSEMADSKDLEPAENFNAKVAIYGRPLRFGAQIGLGSSHHQHVNESFRANSVFAIEAGLYSRLRITRSIEFTLATLYDINGSKTPNFEDNHRRHSISIPAIIRVNTISSDDGLARAFIGGGAYFRQHLRQRVDSEPVPLFLGGPNWDFPNQEWGYAIQLGFQVSRFTLTLDWRNALTKAFSFPIQPELEIYNRNFRIGFGYEFGW